MTEKILTNLKQLGLNSYESKVYLALLKNNPATGYEVSKNSGVPQARAYDTLKTLEERNIVVSTGQKPQTYIPINPEEFLDKHERNFANCIDLLRAELPDLSDDFVEPVININGFNQILNKIKDLIDNAENEIFLELWAKDFKIIEKALENAENRGVSINIVSYRNIEAKIGLIYEHGLADMLEEDLKGRIIIVAVDNKTGTIGIISEDKKSNGIFTRNKAVVFVIKQLVLHDMYLLDVESTLGDELHKTYGKDLVKLRHKIAGSNIILRDR